MPMEPNEINRYLLSILTDTHFDTSHNNYDQGFDKFILMRDVMTPCAINQPRSKLSKIT